ncbi:hypothetical protein [Scytonema sp. NUACC26]|uniref:hypothetical protein n=1 Tax=Scytonema sp. NUACC26 TaxID=3140176 RepID=UPI0034DBF808
MKPETEQLLGTLEVLSQYGGCQPLFWETATQGEFSLWSLLISQGFVRQTDVELAFERWQNIEHWGTPTNQALNDYEYAPPRSERDNDDWNEAIAIQRQEIYYHIQELLSTHLQHQQAYKLSVSQALQSKFEWHHPAFFVSIVVGEMENGHWLCLVPTVPDQVGFRPCKPNQATTLAILVDTLQVNGELIADCPLTNQLCSLLDQLRPIEIYGYYYGGYNYSYDHRIVGAVTPTQSSAIELALQAAEMLVVRKPSIEFLDASSSREITQFMNQCLRDRTLYSLSFWDISYTYEFGQTPVGDWIGVRSSGEFEYNP